MGDLAKNEIYTAEITGYGSDGSGVARICGRAVFVPRAIAGETWRIVITKVGSSAVYGRALEPIALSPERREPDCPYYPRCGGCALRHMSYAEQLRFKLGRVNDALLHIGGQSVRAGRIIPSERTERYRNKGIYAVREKGGRAQAGFFAARSHELVAVDACLLQNELADKCARAVTDFMNENMGAVIGSTASSL